MKIIASPRTLLAYREMSTNALTLISEFIDNLFGHGRATEGHLYWNKETRLLTIVDNGIGLAKLSHLFGLGIGAAPINQTNISRFGQGATAAIVWLADVAEVWTVRGDRGIAAYTSQNVKHVVEVLQEWFDVDDSEWSAASTANVPSELAQFMSGTMIRLKVREKKQLFPVILQQGLSRIYASALRQDRQLIWHDEDGALPLKPYEPGTLLETRLCMLSVRHFEAKLNAGINQQISQREAGISISFGHREILKTREPFGSYDGGKIFGWVDLTPAWHDELTQDKTDFTDDGLKTELYAAIRKEILPLIELLEEEEETKFVADLQLLAEMQIGPIVAAMFPDTSTWEKTRKKKRVKHDPPLPPKAPRRGGLPIRTRPATNLNGLRIKVETHEDHISVQYDPNDELVKTARQQKPVNKLLLKALISDEFAADLVRKGLVVRAGLFTEQQWANFMTDSSISGDTAALASYVKPVLYNRIRELATS